MVAAAAGREDGIPNPGRREARLPDSEGEWLVHFMSDSWMATSGIDTLNRRVLVAQPGDEYHSWVAESPYDASLLNIK